MVSEAHSMPENPEPDLDVEHNGEEDVEALLARASPPAASQGQSAKEERLVAKVRELRRTLSIIELKMKEEWGGSGKRLRRSSLAKKRILQRRLGLCTH